MLKKVMVLLLALAMVASLCACGDSTTTTDDSSAKTSDSAAKTEAPATTDAAQKTEATEVTPGEDVATAVDFESGAYDFAKIAYSFAACDLASTMSIGAFNNSMALRVESPVSDNTFSGTVPYVAFDIVALVGAENVSKIAQISYEIGVDYGDNAFQAVGGYCGVVNNGAETDTNWTIFLEEENPKAYTVDAANLSAEGDTYLYFTVNTDNPIATSDITLCLDNIKFLDASGAELAVDETVSFAQVEGIDDSFWMNLDWSNGCKQPANEVILQNADGVGPTGNANGNWWPNADQSWSWASSLNDDGVTRASVSGYTDLSNINFGPGMVLTIYYSTNTVYADDETYQSDLWKMPILVAQDWVNGGQIQYVLPLPEDENKTKYTTEETRYNQSRTIIQMTYEEINEAFLASKEGAFDADGDGNAINDCDFIGIAGMGGDGFTIYKVTVGDAQ